jgi:hypothetical protein
MIPRIHLVGAWLVTIYGSYGNDVCVEATIYDFEAFLADFFCPYRRKETSIWQQCSISCQVICVSDGSG